MVGGTTARVSWVGLLVSCAPVLLVVLVSFIMDLGMHAESMVASVRALVQLLVIGYILHPLFSYPTIALIYVFLMAILASWEATRRSKYVRKGQFLLVLATLVVCVTPVSAFLIGAVIELENPIDPQYVIPISGMLLGNAVSCIALGLNHLLTVLVEQRARIELYLGFGASKWEATKGDVHEALRTALIPTLNTMRVVGVVSIPGMMTGNILAGQSPDQAARYQTIILYGIFGAGFLSLIAVVLINLNLSFDHEQRLNVIGIRKQTKRGRDLFEALFWAISDLFKSFSCCFRLKTDFDEKENLLSNENHLDESGKCFVETFCFQTSSEPLEDLLLEVVDLSLEFDSRIVFDQVTFKLHRAQFMTISAPSGSGKSQLLRQICNLSERRSGSIFLHQSPGVLSSDRSNSKWRAQVILVPQMKGITMTGSPSSFLETVSKFKNHVRRAAEIQRLAPAIALEWGIERSLFDSNWNDLSGGETQRIILAIALALNPVCLCLDEATNALEESTKIQVEKTLLWHQRDSKTGILLVTHDENQVARLTGSQLC